MIYSVSSSVQISNFLSAIGLGFILGIIYYIIEFVRKTISIKRTAVILQDILFSLVTSLLEFVFMQIYTDGEVRLDLILASAVGFAILCLSVGKYIRRMLGRLSLGLNHIILFFTKPFRVIKKFVGTLFKKYKNNKNVHKNDDEKLKTKKTKKIFYNKFCSNRKKFKNSLENNGL